MGEMIDACKIKVRRPQKNTLLGRPRHRKEDNIKVDFMKTGREDVGWIHPAQDRDHWLALVNLSVQ
jgi:hypothetical protein